MRLFRLIRDCDVSGFSGTGCVAQGCVFDDGTTVLRWLSDTPSTEIHNTPSFLERVHGHGGATHLEYLGVNDPARDQLLQQMAEVRRVSLEHDIPLLKDFFRVFQPLM